MLTRQEREQIVLDLYNQGKTIRDIAKEVRISFRDIGTVLKKEEEKERQKKQLENNTTNIDSNNNQRGMSLSAQAYELFSQGKNPIQVAIELNLRESQVTRYYKEYWKLKGLYKLNLVHEEIKDGILYFLKLYTSSKAAKMSANHVMKLLEIANNNLPALKDKFEKLQRNVSHLESSELDASITLENLKNQIKNANQLLYSCRLSYQEELRKMLQLHRHIIRLNALLRQFKNSDEGYPKIRYAAKQAVESVLSDRRQLLRLAILSLIESLRAHPVKFNFLVHGMPSPLTMSKSTRIDQGSSSNYHTNPFSYYYNQNSYAETLTELIMNEATKLYEKMVNDFANQTMTNAAAGSSAKLLPSLRYTNGKAYVGIVKSIPSSTYLE